MFLLGEMPPNYFSDGWLWYVGYHRDKIMALSCYELKISKINENRKYQENKK